MFQTLHTTEPTLTNTVRLSACTHVCTHRETVCTQAQEGRFRGGTGPDGSTCESSGISVGFVRCVNGTTVTTFHNSLSVKQILKHSNMK